MIPAVPKYLGEQFDSAPPGHLFSLYFPVWNPGSWEIEKTTKTSALKETLRLPPESRKQVDALRERQQSLLLLLDENCYFMFEAIATAPLVTGMGMEHPLENGFAFLNPYGIPYLPGSSIKGVLRRAAEELAEDDHADWPEAAIDQLFGHEDSNNARRGVLTFWDSIPEIKGNSLAMDVMTPHYGEYYQGKQSPHDAGQPNPIVFMVIPPESKFNFHIIADEERMPGDLKDSKWKPLIESAFEYAFEWLGFGAKTAVGYGALERLSEEDIARARRESANAAIRCEWVDNTIQELAAIHNANPEQIIRGKPLAKAWAALTEPAIKKQALADIRSRWESKDWWDAPPGRAAKIARSIYEGQA